MTSQDTQSNYKIENRFSLYDLSGANFHFADQWKFDEIKPMTRLFHALDNHNSVIAGGIVPRLIVPGLDEFGPSDIDVFIYGKDEKEKKETVKNIIRNLFDLFRSLGKTERPGKIYYWANKSVCTIYHTYIEHPIQIIVTNKENEYEILNGFDFHASQAIFRRKYGSECYTAYGSRGFIETFENKQLTITSEYINARKVSRERVAKYCKRYSLSFPEGEASNFSLSGRDFAKDPVAERVNPLAENATPLGVEPKFFIPSLFYTDEQNKRGLQRYANGTVYVLKMTQDSDADLILSGMDFSGSEYGYQYTKKKSSSLKYIGNELLEESWISVGENFEASKNEKETHADVVTASVPSETTTTLPAGEELPASPPDAYSRQGVSRREEVASFANGSSLTAPGSFAKTSCSSESETAEVLDVEPPVEVPPRQESTGENKGCHEKEVSQKPEKRKKTLEEIEEIVRKVIASEFNSNCA